MSTSQSKPDDERAKHSAASKTQLESSERTEADAKSDEPMIRLRDVKKSFGANQVLRGLSFDVPRGQTLAIMGPSGTGKSVVLRHIIGLLKPDSGSVMVEGREVTQLKRKDLSELRKRMGFLFQEGALINWLSVGDNVALPLRENTNMSEKEIKELVQHKLELVKIPDAWQKMPSEISGGMKKRVGLARALITDPEIILYDEPNAGLDPEISRSINELIRDVQHQLHVTSIVVEHRVPCVRTVADQVLFLEKGVALMQAPPEEFFNSSNERVQEFLGDEARMMPAKPSPGKTAGSANDGSDWRDPRTLRGDEASARDARAERAKSDDARRGDAKSDESNVRGSSADGSSAERPGDAGD